jgi:hypothetical protein
MNGIAQCWVCFKPVDLDGLGNTIACHFGCRASLEEEEAKGFQRGIEAAAKLVSQYKEWFRGRAAATEVIDAIRALAQTANGKKL